MLPYIDSRTASVAFRKSVDTMSLMMKKGWPILVIIATGTIGFVGFHVLTNPDSDISQVIPTVTLPFRFGIAQDENKIFESRSPNTPAPITTIAPTLEPQVIITPATWSSDTSETAICEVVENPSSVEIINISPENMQIVAQALCGQFKVESVNQCIIGMKARDQLRANRFNDKVQITSATNYYINVDSQDFINNANAACGTSQGNVPDSTKGYYNHELNQKHRSS